MKPKILLTVITMALISIFSTSFVFAQENTARLEDSYYDIQWDDTPWSITHKLTPLDLLLRNKIVKAPDLPLIGYLRTLDTPKSLPPAPLVNVKPVPVPEQKISVTGMLKKASAASLYMQGATHMLTDASGSILYLIKDSKGLLSDDLIGGTVKITTNKLEPVVEGKGLKMITYISSFEIIALPPDLIKKAQAKIDEHNTNITNVLNTEDAKETAQKNFDSLYNEYNKLFATLPPDSPFQHIDPVFIAVYPPVEDAINKSRTEIEILTKAIQEDDLETIKAHLHIQIPEVGDAVSILNMFIDVFNKVSTQISEEQLPLIRAYIKAIQYLKDIFNPTSYALVNWGNGDGCLGLVFKLPDSSEVKLNISIETGELMPNFEKMVEVVMNARKEIAQHTGADIADIHVNGAAEEYDQETGLYIVTKLTINLNEYIFTYVDAKDGLGMKLESIYNSHTNQELLGKAIEQLKGVFNPTSYALVNWGNGDGCLGLVFKLPDDSTVKLNINISTGELMPDSLKLKGDVLKIREEIARQMDISIENAHVNGADIEAEWINGACLYIAKIVTVSAGNFVITYIRTGINDQFVLTSLVNRETGVDLLAAAREHLNKDAADEYILEDWRLLDNKISFLFRGTQNHSVEIIVDINTGIVREMRERIDRYEESGDIHLITHSNITYLYDEKGVSRQKLDDSEQLAYNASGNLLSAVHYILTYNYNKIGLLTDYINDSVFFDSNHVQVSSSHATLRYTYSPDGKLMEETGEYCWRDASGRIGAHSYTVTQYSYDGAGRLIELRHENYGYDDNGNMFIVSSAYEGYSYYENGTIREAISQEEKFDGQGTLLERYRTFSQYNENGVLVTQGTDSEKIGPDGQMLECYHKEATSIDVYGKVREEVTNGTVFAEAERAIGFYSTQSRYNEFGVLTECSSNIVIPNTSPQPGIERNLHVEYVIDDHGNIVYTRVWDDSGNENPELGGEGYKDAGSIVIKFVGNMKKEWTGNDDVVVIKDDASIQIPQPKTVVNPAATMIANESDLAQRKTIEAQVIQNQGTTTPTLASSSLAETLSLQNK